MLVAEDPEAFDRIEAAELRVDVDRIADRHPVACRDGDVEQRVRRCGEVEVDERDRTAVPDDHVLDAEVVVADDRVSGRLGSAGATPDGVHGYREAASCAMEIALETR